MWRFSSRRHHPRTQRALRWWVARARAPELILTFLGLVALLSLILSLLAVATEQKQADRDQYSEGPSRRVRMWLASARALLGVDAFPRQSGNVYHEALATLAGAVGALIPALIIGVLATRLFYSRFLVWRDKINVSTMAELRSGVSSDRSLDGMLAVRFL